MQLGKYSIGIGDRFSQQGRAQLAALVNAKQAGVDITPVWNKSFREHQIIHSQPGDTRREADQAVQALHWQAPYFVDADHINLKTVDLFIDACDFYTLDVADYIGREADDQDVQAFADRYNKYIGPLHIPGIAETFQITGKLLLDIADKYLYAVREAGRIYRHIAARRGDRPFVVEVSMDETDTPQTPVELFFILAAIADEGIPAQTIAPKFSGRFNKGVDYVGDISRFSREFAQDIAIIQYVCKNFTLPHNLKLSVHSGSDKFSIYNPIAATLKQFDAGLHLKTAGTTWLEELIGLAMAGGEALEIAKVVYRQAWERYDELCKPYATVIDIHKEFLPDPAQVDKWDSFMYAESLRHVPGIKHFNPHFRQLLHVGYKVAAEMGAGYIDALQKHEAIIAVNVTENLYTRHIKPLFMGI